VRRPQKPTPFIPYIYTREELRRLLDGITSYQENTPGKDSCWIVTLASNCRRMSAQPTGSNRKSCLESAIQHIHN
jgi:hypothetical protein